MARVFEHGELHLALLALVADEPMHGYDLMERLSQRVGRRYKASPGSIYPALRSLEDEGLLSGQTDDDVRTYTITAAGRTALERRGDRLAALEDRLKARFGRGGVERALQRFNARVTEAWCLDDVAPLEDLLDEAARKIEQKGKG